MSLSTLATADQCRPELSSGLVHKALSGLRRPKTNRGRTKHCGLLTESRSPSKHSMLFDTTRDAGTTEKTSTCRFANTLNHGQSRCSSKTAMHSSANSKASQCPTAQNLEPVTLESPSPSLLPSPLLPIAQYLIIKRGTARTNPFLQGAITHNPNFPSPPPSLKNVDSDNTM